MANLASTYRNQGRWAEAESLDLQVMEIKKKVLGPEHPDTLTGINNLACTWKGQGRHDDALDLMRRCVQLNEQVLGPHHPHTMSSLCELDIWQKIDHSLRQHS
ncbi:Tetratricopeptide repeat-domain-containing protein [Microdochium trichocladiopsis]|uniref:Tetratricopeptide repeat-domain-containing protein n=1 Tax=Microdochium trichocladiopsis TaxID=1682393 RepID=A0A9P8XNU8_9PEZI|nr:Tetratricopeptide repeat-domain-containing protein [Microdochium trichocladiopsis]XP_046017839.1 Tetratricopeptide repeat-domain-containing protein [Microdochium trichocladiopsis]KAH7007845.1 Tetratricopeptide repeat-domain-containing protein [Microdochium trichocladiopsis]KAH7039784.1 Tetratricopeptide repeat-domain-containing protein [Microdochium trichocladiopsis]